MSTDGWKVQQAVIKLWKKPTEFIIETNLLFIYGVTCSYDKAILDDSWDIIYMLNKWCVASAKRGENSVYFEKIRVFKAGDLPE